MPVSAGIGAAGSLASGYFGNQAAKRAGAIGKDAADAANTKLTGVYDENKNLYNPYINAGTEATSNLTGLLNGDDESFQKYLNSTNYNFRLNQGLQATKTAGAPALNSGATLRALNDYGQGMAGDALSGYQSMLQNLSTQGLGASNNKAELGQNYANSFGANLLTGAGAQAGGVTAANNSTQNMIKGLATNASSFNGDKISSFAKGLFGGGA